MRSPRVRLTIVACLVISFDLVVAVRFYMHGYPKYVVATKDGFIARTIPFTSTDWSILLLILSFQAVVFYFTAKSWSTKRRIQT